ncbi:MAG: carbon-nitrogen hydrolase family protein [Saprospiraceae bacterium]|nr:carbon-nitrogen hydrolase family protein [Saprospiraceae bacterium]
MKISVGLVQESPVFFDVRGTMDKLGGLVRAYAAKGCQLLVFPESFIPGYPRGFSFGTTIGSRSEAGRDLYAIYHQNSIQIDGKEMAELEDLAHAEGVYLVIGATEKMPDNGSLYCSMFYISPTQGLLGVHRKIKPTGSERIVWAAAGGESLVTFQTAIGRIGGLICWENYMPLARMAMYQRGLELYIAPTADDRDGWLATMQHIALEGKCFVMGCNQYFTKSMYPEKYRKLVQSDEEVMCRGGSVIVNPMGQIIAGPLYDQVGCLIVDLDLQEIVRSKFDFDPLGHYSRNDIFNFEVNNQPEMKTEDGLEDRNN